MSILIGQTAPQFNAPAVDGSGSVMPTFDWHKTISGKAAVLFFYPLDFTFVCPTELVALNQAKDMFLSRNVVVASVSVDSHFSHQQWRAMAPGQGGIGPVWFPMVSDLSKNITQAYGVMQPIMQVAYRATIIIDTKGIVRVVNVHDLPIGRSVDDILRILDALHHVTTHGEVCPVNWKAGTQALKANVTSVNDYFKHNANH
jgi:peroxiredoxin 2/4